MGLIGPAAQYRGIFSTYSGILCLLSHACLSIPIPHTQVTRSKHGAQHHHQEYIPNTITCKELKILKGKVGREEEKEDGIEKFKKEDEEKEDGIEELEREMEEKVKEEEEKVKEEKEKRME